MTVLRIYEVEIIEIPIIMKGEFCRLMRYVEIMRARGNMKTKLRRKECNIPWCNRAEYGQ